MPFGEGPCNCLGQNLAYTSMLTILATLLGRFPFRLADEVRGLLSELRMYIKGFQPEVGLPSSAADDQQDLAFCWNFLISSSCTVNAELCDLLLSRLPTVTWH